MADGAAVKQITELPGGGLKVLAPAKINLNLLVGPRRADGYHALDSFVCKVTLNDEIILRPSPAGRLAFRCQGMDCGDDDRNLALRAARLLKELAPRAGAEIELTKSIPPGKGLGGGSSDAAAVLMGLDRLWRLDLGPQRLAELGAGLGSDVPLFIGGPCCRMMGRGEIIQPAAIHPFAAILCLPGLVCPTGEIYRAFDEMEGNQRRTPVSLPQLPAEVLASSPPSAWRDRLANDLLPAALQVRPELEYLMLDLTLAAGAKALLTGSGSGCFVLFDGPDHARLAMESLPSRLSALCRLVAQNPW